jgi:hypothetical protein
LEAIAEKMDLTRDKFWEYNHQGMRLAVLAASGESYKEFLHLHAIKLKDAGTLYMYLIIATLGIRAKVLQRHKIKNHHIISLAFEMRSPSGLTIYFPTHFL